MSSLAQFWLFFSAGDAPLPLPCAKENMSEIIGGYTLATCHALTEVFWSFLACQVTIVAMGCLALVGLAGTAGFDRFRDEALAMDHYRLI